MITGTGVIFVLVIAIVLFLMSAFNVKGTVGWGWLGLAVFALIFVPAL